jgi:hypothetical protein
MREVTKNVEKLVKSFKPTIIVLSIVETELSADIGQL